MIQPNLTTPTVNLTLALSPTGHIYLDSNSNQEYMPAVIAKKIQTPFKNGYALGLLRLGLVNFAIALPPSFAFWQRFAQRFVTEICKTSELPNQTGNKSVSLIPEVEFQEFVIQAPFMNGGDISQPKF